MSERAPRRLAKKRRKVVSSDEEKEEIKRHFRAFGKRRVGGKKVRPRRIPRTFLRDEFCVGVKQRAEEEEKRGRAAVEKRGTRRHRPSVHHPPSSILLRQVSSLSPHRRAGGRRPRPLRCILAHVLDPTKVRCFLIFGAGGGFSFAHIVCCLCKRKL